MFSILFKPNFNFSFTLILSSANAFSLDQSKFLSFVKELIHFATFESMDRKVQTVKPNNKMIDWSKFKALTIADNNSDVARMANFVFDRVENIAGKGENAGYQHFLLFPQCFQKAFSLRQGL